jgi:hypothetical protein
MSFSYQEPNTPEDNQVCPAPPYNATNFTSANPVIFNTLVSNAKNQPQYPLPVGSDASQVYRNTQNISYFNNLNLQTQAVRSANGTSGNLPYPQFRSEAERLMYRQGQAMTAARNQITGQNPSAPAGVPCSSIYGIIYSS